MHLKPGDRLPTERELMESFQCSKGSAREALKALEVEGLVSTRTGPTGGAYLNQAGTEPASRALRNYLHFQHLDGEQVYQLRKVIEVELAVSVLGRLSEDDYQAPCKPTWTFAVRRKTARPASASSAWRSWSSTPCWPGPALIRC
jgi:GntR family transcriptional regulator, transcriptional repressor for pyruvate dehydrogenase complex